ncbi:flagellar basal-body MS-ring/collar protein FliF [Hydrogenophaga sp.]|uniref:flagellar basal-body MS-ring/collar protein FliF n=1 Tax=Hydrogenophaga sp. TaxID=1904254 RepID=UPI0019ADC229|nr:flagellar basal-body MS-ring/collar protein FliF [Hydrogenophaga sp.]MBD3894210.1 flagellar basal body M-ring protein FliF [Hydrogenophaga sp.]
MSSTVAPLELQPASRNPLGAGLARLDQGQKIKLGLGALALLALLLAFFLLGRQPEWRVLYANLSDKDGGAIVAQLTQMNVPYQHGLGGQAIMVPADLVHDTRLRLASQGLPKGSITGFELMEANRFGMTQFQERLTFQRGLEGELTRSIQSLSSVQSARVHLALPNQNGFFREQQKPSSSVLLTLHPGRTLDRAQVAGIVHLVASSVPEMNPKAVSVVDAAGNLLSQSPDAQSQSSNAQRLLYVQQIEQLHVRRILDILEPLVGPGNVRAQVNAEVDFSVAESTSEQHRPNQNPDSAAVRSQQVIENSQATPAAPAGVPGAVSNQPPVPGSAPINAAAAPLGVSGNPEQAAGNSRRESLTNYEVDKTVRVVREASGTVRRLSAAVVVNHRNSTDRNGNPSSAPIAPEQLEQMSSLVRQTIGFNEQRGDSVNVVNAAFKVVPLSQEAPLSWWQQTSNQELLRSLAWPLGLLGLGLLVLLGLVRPAFKQMQATAALPRHAPAQLSALLDETPERPGLPSPTALAAPSADIKRLADAKRLALENPVAVANIVKGWVNGEAPA